MIAWNEVVRRSGAARLGAILGLGFVVAAASIQAQSARVPAVTNQTKVGGGLYEVVVGESTNSVYVASTAAGNRKIFALDPQTLAVKGEIDMEANPAFGLSFNNKTQTLYTTNTRSNNVTAVDVKTGKVVATIASPDGGNAHVFRSLVDEATNTVYISLPGNPSRIWVIDGATNTLKHEIADTGGRSTGLALDSAGNRLFTSSIASSEVLEIDLATRTVTRRYPSGGQGTTHLAYDPKTGRLFTSNQQSGNVTVLDTKTTQVLQTIPTGAGALGLTFDHANNLVYVANRQAGTVTVINAASYAVVATLQAGTMPNTVALDTRTGSAYVSNKARSVGRGGRGGRAGAPAGAGAPVAAAPPSAPAATTAPAAPPAAPPADEGGDTVTRIAL
jgi:YVTN family beta-propeller protein